MNSNAPLAERLRPRRLDELAGQEHLTFEVNSALLSRCQVYVLKPLDHNDLEKLLQHAIATDEVMKQFQITLKETEALINISGGDARKLLNLFELVVTSSSKKKIE